MSPIRGLAASCLSAGARAIARAGRRRHGAILAYHGVGSVPRVDDPELLCIDPEQFRSHVSLLAEAGYRFVTVEEYVRDSASAVEGPPGTIALSFDDGLVNLLTDALPILSELGAVATVYVPTGLIGEPYPWAKPEAGLRVCTEDELGRLVAAGWEIGAHTVDHRDLSRCSYEESVTEMTASREALRRITGGEVSTFAYPYARHSPDARRAARDVGFLAALSYSTETDGSSRFALSRELVTPQHGPVSLVLKVLGRYDSLSTSGPGTMARKLTGPLRLRPKPPLRERV